MTREAKVTYEGDRKPCSGCGQLLHVTKFYLRADGYYQSRCRPCMRESSKRWEGADGIRRKAARYGVTVDELTLMFAEAKGRCAICARVRALHVDHCHATGAVRGLLCGPCNRAIGVLGDTAESLDVAAEYLRGCSDTGGAVRGAEEGVSSKV